MAILDEKGLSGVVKHLIDLVFIGGIGILISLPVSLRWYFDKINRMEGENYYFLLVFLFITGLFALIIMHEMRKVFKALNKKNPFTTDNVKSFRRMAIASFLISAAYVIKIIFFNSFLTIIIAMVFIMAGLFLIILSEVFHQAVIVKEENDLTI